MYTCLTMVLNLCDWSAVAEENTYRCCQWSQCHWSW